MQKVAYRSYRPGLTPRRTRMQVPGWAGLQQPRRDGSHEFPWHCMPFTESATYGTEVSYPHEGEVRVITREGVPTFEGDIATDPTTGALTPPFRNFGGTYYTYQLLLDLRPEPGFAIRTEPHPRFYSDATGTTPIAVPALIRDFWPMLYFCVFKSPPEGQTHIFRAGEPMLQLIVLPQDPDYELVAMSEEEAAERELRSRRIHESRKTLGAETHWTSATNTAFDGTYRFLLRASKAEVSFAPGADKDKDAVTAINASAVEG